MSRFCVLCLAAMVIACDEPEPEVAAEPAPELGLLEFPISLRAATSNYEGAYNVEVTLGGIWLDGTQVVTLENGRLSEADQSELGIGPIETTIASAAAKSRANIRMHASVAYATMSRLMAALDSAGVREVAFAVRPPGDPQRVYLQIDNFDTRADADELASFDEREMPSWDDVRRGWPAMYGACRAGRYVDCDYQSNTIAEGGQAHITLFVSGNLSKVVFTRVADEEEEEARPTPQPVQLIDGIEALPQAEEEVEADEEAVFAWRFNATVESPSPVSETVRQVCGSRTCSVLIDAEGQVPSMRVLSFLGAAFPTGTQAPHVLFQVAE